MTGESLTCYTCKMGFKGKCLFTSTETCSNSKPNCYWGSLAFNVSRLMSLQTRGCLASSLCNQTETGTLLTAGYSITRTCCSTNLCNGATSTQLPLTASGCCPNGCLEQLELLKTTTKSPFMSRCCFCM
ncbi:sperm acrosome membrane-associated protein 4 [Lates calcarifer]|uniref:Sperm acrosome membrane-associated protein 4 n=1 Tax=Lates calcarifer TaxID=8187 RepID=A0AAJ7PZG7_LATCA|nr:sperm acrosome membrane-associated protein 4 [Lates calcarifer]